MALAIVAGVPALVFVSVGPVALVVGPGSIALWAISAGVGMLMAVVFASLVSGQEHIAGGIAGAGAAVFRSSSRSLSVLTQWSYWLGWSPALGISAALIVELVHTAGL